jgi:hypothetical protein
LDRRLRPLPVGRPKKQKPERRKGHKKMAVPYFPHPAISNGRLYISHGDTLSAFNIAA